MIKTVVQGTCMNHGIAGQTFVAEFTYMGDVEPLAIFIKMSGPMNEVQWTIGRDLLMAGLDGQSGEGDVIVCGAHPWYFITLMPNDQGFGFSLPYDRVQQFLADTYKLVPKQREVEILAETDVDAELALLLGNDD